MPPNGQLPESLVLSSEVFDSGGVYLLDSGADLLLYVDQEAPEQIVQVRGQHGLQDLMAGLQSGCLPCALVTSAGLCASSAASSAASLC